MARGDLRRIGVEVDQLELQPRRLTDQLLQRFGIFDANITNTIAAAIMMYFGSGPIRGFAVVLLIGIITSVFTAVNFTRMLVSIWVKSKRPRAINI